MRLTTWLSILERLQNKLYYERIPAIGNDMKELCGDVLDIFVYHIKDEIKYEENEHNGKMP